MSFFCLEYHSSPDYNYHDKPDFGGHNSSTAKVYSFRLGQSGCLARVTFVNPDDSDHVVVHYYHLVETDVYIFIIGMCYLTPEQKDLIGTKATESRLDAELIPILYQAGGSDELTKLYGEHNIVIIKPREGSIQCISSHFGLLPLYYVLNNDGFYVCNSLLHIGQITGNTKLNEAVLAQLCLYNYSISDDALLKNCHILLPSTVMSFAKDHANFNKYWSPLQLLGKQILNKKQSIELADHSLNQAIGCYAKQVTACALSLTGGWDGRLVLAYLLHYLDPDKIQLYSFGSGQSSDITIPTEIARCMSLNYSPFILDEHYLESSYLQSARDTSIYSDGYRSIQRAHYLFAMRNLSARFSSVISGNCGSNVLKSTAGSPSVVMNQRILELLSAPDPEAVLAEHHKQIVKFMPEVFANLRSEEFIQSILQDTMKEILEIKVHSYKVSAFIFTFLERKYFGPELVSYQHLIGNYSPFINLGFLEGLAQTPYFNANQESSGIYGNWGNSLLYANLMNSNNKRLASFKSDKYVSLTELLNPLNYPLILLKQLYRRKFLKLAKTPDNYNTGSTMSLFIASNPDIFGSLHFQNAGDKNMLSALITAQYWHYNVLHNKVALA